MTILNQTNLEKIERYRNGTASNEERAWVEMLFLEGETNDNLRQALEKDWIEMLGNHAPARNDLAYLLEVIHRDIIKNEVFKRRTILYRFARIYMKAAAIFLLPLLLTGTLLYFNAVRYSRNDKAQSSFSIHAPIGARVSFNLPDGTVGKLNSGSILSYSLPFDKNRHVSLEGEGYFEVKHDEQHPFEITAGTSRIKVLGTKFNLCAYPGENYVEVVLEEGKVEYTNQKVSGIVRMMPSERLVFQNGQVIREVADPAKYNSWTEGKLVFKGDPMNEVVRHIERLYNIKIELNDKELEKYSFRGTFENDQLEEVLRFLSMTSPITYKINPGKLLQDGTWEKEKVIIYLKK